MSKSDLLQRIHDGRIVALIRAGSPACLVDCARALSAGGVRSVELTMTTPGAIGMIPDAVRELPDVIIGLGTVLDAGSARAAIAAGAKFIVTPAVRPAVIAACQEAGVPVFSGALTPTEVHLSWEMGADVVKIFPAEFFGPAYLKALRAPFPEIRLMPTGGVTVGTIGEFLKSGAFAVAAGSALVPTSTLEAGDWAAIAENARRFVAATRA